LLCQLLGLMNTLLTALLRFMFKLSDELLPPARQLFVQVLLVADIGAPGDNHRDDRGCDGCEEDYPETKGQAIPYDAAV
jgi:hypothetical protein